MSNFNSQPNLTSLAPLPSRVHVPNFPTNFLSKITFKVPGRTASAMRAPTRGARKDLWRLEIYVDILYTPRADFFRGSASLGFRLLDFDALVIGDEGAFTEDGETHFLRGKVRACRCVA